MTLLTAIILSFSILTITVTRYAMRDADAAASEKRSRFYPPSKKQMHPSQFDQKRYDEILDGYFTALRRVEEIGKHGVR